MKIFSREEQKGKPIRFTIVNKTKVVYLIVFFFVVVFSRENSYLLTILIFKGRSHVFRKKNAYFFIVCFIYINAAEDRMEKAEYQKQMTNESYTFRVNLVKRDGVYEIPVKQRAKSAIIKLWRKERTGKHFALGKLTFLNPSSIILKPKLILSGC